MRLKLLLFVLNSLVCYQQQRAHKNEKNGDTKSSGQSIPIF